MSLVAELKRRKVLKVGAAYLVVAWLAVQAASIGFPAFETPAWALRIFILVALLGFPCALVLVWMLDVTPEGLKVETATTGTRRIIAVAIALVVLALGWYFVGQPAVRVAVRGSEPLTGPPQARAVRGHCLVLLPPVLSALRLGSLPGVSGLPLPTQGKHEHRVDFRHIPVQGDVAMRESSDDQRTGRSLDRPPDERVVFEHINGPDDALHASYRIFAIVLDKMVEDAFEIIDNLGRQLDSSHAQRASFLAAGRTARLPATRCSRKRRTSFQGTVLPDAATSA